MLRYRDHEWLVRHGPTRFEVYIAANHRKPEDVQWSMELHYIAAGAQWRRVQESHRPSVQLSVSSWEMPGTKWTDLEQCDFWDPDKGVPEKDLWMPVCLRMKGGDMDVVYQEGPEAKFEMKTGMPVNWKVRERLGQRYLVEMAASMGSCLRPPPEEKEVMVLPDGTEEVVQEEKEDPADWWKGRADIYALEEVPFGKITVCVPRNAGDHLAYARRRVRDLLGLSRPPEAYQINDYLSKAPKGEDEEPAANGLYDDVTVNLHYHGFYEDQ